MKFQKLPKVTRKQKYIIKFNKIYQNKLFFMLNVILIKCVNYEQLFSLIRTICVHKGNENTVLLDVNENICTMYVT